jgi:hypothetical protein
MRRFRLIFYFIVFALFSSLEGGNPIIFMVSPPRSLSTAFTRMMYERGDCAIYHEPFYNPYCRIYFPEYAKEVYRKEAYTSLEQVKWELFSAAEERPVFVKEISNAAEEFLLKDSSLIHHEQLKFVFLLRNPHHVALSFYRKCPDQGNALQDFMGFEALYRVYCYLEKELHQTFHIVLAEDLVNHPEETIQKFCEKMHLPYLPEALNWKKLDEDFDPVQEWHEFKWDEHVDIWHGNAISSSGFGTPSSYALNEFGEPTFEEVEDLHDREILQKAYEYNLSFYNRMKDKIQSAL